MFVVRKSYVKN